MMMQPQQQLKNAFEVLVNEQYIVLKRGISSLWFSRSHPTPTNNPNINAAFNPKVAPVPEFRLLKEDDQSCRTLFADFTCHGLAYGLIGLFLQDKLLLIRAATSVGRLPFATKDEVFKVAKICVLGLCSRGEMVGDLGLDKCTQDSCTKPVIIMPSPNEPFMLSASFSKLQEQDQNSAARDLDSSSASLNLQPPPTFQSTSLAAAAAGGAVQKTWNQIKQTASSVSGKSGRVGSAGTSGSSATAVGGFSSSTGSAEGSNSRQDEKEKFERRFIDELYKMFNETNSFYFSWTGDLTQSVQRQQKQRQYLQKSGSTDIRAVPLWKRVDDRFFWNRYMLKSVVEAFETPSSTSAAAQQSTPTNEKPTAETTSEDLLRTYSQLWVLPIIQGFVQIEKCYFDLTETSPVGGVAFSENFGESPQQPKISAVVINSQNPASNFLELGRDYYLMTLISRRSRFRAGTRYKRRGLDEEGRCANYVETEQIFSYGSHTVAFVLVRGSVPLFWSQVGSKYRPPPRLERSEAENQTAFRRHFEHEFAIYEGDSVVVSLIEQSGREKILGDAFLEHVIKMDDARLAYVTFDFHDYCRGMRFENVSLLIDRIYEFIKDIRYCWVDEDGMICEQRGVFRINCIDCLDRTNIVMTAIAKAVMDIQLVRLGLLPPEGQLPSNSRRIFQLMWAHNGDTISRQYAGTAALKGDYTRTGERKISGVVRDGVNSANRYYLNRFKDAYRQAVIDIMQGNAVSEALSSPEDKPSLLSTVSGGVLSKSGSSSSISGMANSNSGSGGGNSTASLSVNDPEYHERIKLVIEDCKKILVPQEEVILGGWPLVDADPVTGTQLSSTTPRNSTTELPESEMDTVLILTKDCYYVADYDDQTDRVVKYQKVALEDLEKIELGAEPNYSSGGPFGRGSSSGSSRNPPLVSYALRLHYSIADQTGYYHVFRSTGTRFFNNMAIPIRTREEALESLKAIAESFKVALSVKQCNVPFHELSRLEKRKSRRLYGSTGSNSGAEQPSAPLSGRFRSVIGGGVGGGDNSASSNSGGGAPRKLLTGMYSSFSRVLRGKIAGGLQLDGLAGAEIKSKSTTAEDHDQQQQHQNNSVQVKVNQGGQPPEEEMMIEEEEEEVEMEDECSEDECSSASESTASIMVKNRGKNRKNLYNPASSSSSLVVEPTRNSALSCSSELLSESELDLGCASCSELMLPPISELGSPVDDNDLIDGRGYGGLNRENMDRVLESCGILVTSPPLIRVGGGGNSREATPTEHFHRTLSSRSPSPTAKGVLADVDDFVLDSMKKASLRQLHRKAVSSVSLSGGPSSSGSKSPKASASEKTQKVPISENSHQRSRCIFSSELALNSIVSQSIKRDISYDGPGSLKLSSSLSTDAIDGGGGTSVSVAKNQQLLNSSSFVGGFPHHYHQDQLRSFDDSLNVFLESHDHDHLNRANLDSAMLLASGAMGGGSKESSLSVSDLAGSIGGGSVSSGGSTGGGSGLGVGGGLKTSLSSTTLQNSGPMSLNLPNFHPHNSNSLHLNTCASSISISGGDPSGGGDHHNLNIPSIVSVSSSTSTPASSSFTSSFMVKKDLVLSPLTRIAQKGMQSLGLNLRSSNAGGGNAEVVDAELEKRKMQTRSRIIEI